MVFYEYRSKRGEIVERDFSMGEAPDAIVVGRTHYQRVFSSPRIQTTKRVVGASLPDRRVLLPELAAKVDSWTPEGSPIFTSKTSAKRFSEESKRLRAQGKTDTEYHYDDVPSGAEVRAKREAEVKKYRADWLKRPRPKNL